MLNEFRSTHILKIEKKFDKSNKAFSNKYIKCLDFLIFVAFFWIFKLITNSAYCWLGKIKSITNFYITFTGIMLKNFNLYILTERKLRGFFIDTIEVIIRY